MLGLLLDAAVLVGLVMFLNQDSDSPGYGKAFAAAFAIAILALVASFGLASLGFWGLLLLIPGVAVVAGLVLWIVFDVRPMRAAVGGGVYLLYKVALTFLVLSLAR